MGLGIYGLQHRFFRPTMQRYCTRKPKSSISATVYSLFTLYLLSSLFMSEILESQGLKIIIHGGNNQILPNATHAIQNIYIGGEKVSSRQISAANGIIVTEDGNIVNIPSAEPEQEPSDNLTDEQQRLSLYI